MPNKRIELAPFGRPTRKGRGPCSRLIRGVGLHEHQIGKGRSADLLLWMRTQLSGLFRLDELRR